jgi:DNA-binding PadR family transcriptional regulator
METLKGHIDLLVLAVVEAKPMHGYEIISELRTRSKGTFDLAEGSVYPVLHKLEAAKLLTSTWTTESGRRRRTYKITPRGTRALREQEVEWKRFSAGVSLVLKPRLA